MSNKILNEYNLFLDTNARSFGSEVNPSFYLSNSIVQTTSNSKFRCRLISAQIPFSFNQVNNSNNTLRIEWNISSFGNIVIPNGNYDILGLLSAIQSRIITLISAPLLTLNFTYDPFTSTTVFQYGLTQGTINQIICKFSLNPLLGKQTGFRDQDAVFTFATPASSPYDVNVNPSKFIFVRSEPSSLISNSNYEAITQSCNLSNILACVPINSNPNEYITFFQPMNVFTELTNTKIDTIAVYLTDSTNQEFLQDFTLNWTFVLNIQEIEDPMLDSTRQHIYSIVNSRGHEFSSSIIDDKKIL